MLAVFADGSRCRCRGCSEACAELRTPPTPARANLSHRRADGRLERKLATAATWGCYCAATRGADRLVYRKLRAARNRRAGGAPLGASVTCRGAGLTIYEGYGLGGTSGARYQPAQ